MKTAQRIALLEREVAGLDVELRRLGVPTQALAVPVKPFNVGEIGGLLVGESAYVTPVALARGEDGDWYLCGYFGHWPQRSQDWSMRVRRSRDGWHVRDTRPKAQYKPRDCSGPDWIPVCTFDKGSGT